MFKLLVKFLFYIVAKIAELIMTPIVAFITTIFPSLGTIISNVEYFLSHYVFDTLKWFKMFCINCLAFPSELLAFLISVFSILISIYVSMRLYKGILTLYQKLKP